MLDFARISSQNCSSSFASGVTRHTDPNIETTGANILLPAHSFLSFLTDWTPRLVHRVSLVKLFDVPSVYPNPNPRILFHWRAIQWNTQTESELRIRRNSFFILLHVWIRYPKPSSTFALWLNVFLPSHGLTRLVGVSLALLSTRASIIF